MFGIVYENGKNGRGGTDAYNLLFNSHQSAYEYMESMNDILEHYTGSRISYYVQPTERSFDEKNYNYD